MFKYLLPVFCVLTLGAAGSASEIQTRGWVEHARILPDRLLMSAKLDSGARTTSIHAEILDAGAISDPEEGSDLAKWLADKESDAIAMLSTRMVDGQAPDDPTDEVAPVADSAMQDMMPETITFRLTSRGGKQVIYNEPVVRWVSIRRRGGGSIVRPVVMMDLCVAGVKVRGEVNLADRTGFNYPLLIGRNMLREGNIGVDSRQIFSAKRACPSGE